MEQNVAFMTSPIGDLPINTDGLLKAVDEIVRLNRVQDELQELNMKYYNEAKDCKREIAKLKEDREKCINALSEQYSFKTTQDGVFCDVFDIVRKQAVKEFVEKLKADTYQAIELNTNSNVILVEDIDDLLKEYVVELLTKK